MLGRAGFGAGQTARGEQLAARLRDDSHRIECAAVRNLDDGDAALSECGVRIAVGVECRDDDRDVGVLDAVRQRARDEPAALRSGQDQRRQRKPGGHLQRAETACAEGRIERAVVVQTREEQLRDGRARSPSAGDEHLAVGDRQERGRDGLREIDLCAAVLTEREIEIAIRLQAKQRRDLCDRIGGGTGHDDAAQRVDAEREREVHFAVPRRRARIAPESQRLASRNEIGIEQPVRRQSRRPDPVLQTRIHGEMFDGRARDEQPPRSIERQTRALVDVAEVREAEMHAAAVAESSIEIARGIDLDQRILRIDGGEAEMRLAERDRGAIA